MRMIELLGGGRLRLVDQPPPDRPLAAGEVEGPTEVSLVSPGTELQAYLGELGSPVSSGYATVFRIAARGSGVTDLREGQLVFAMGAHTGFQRFAARDVVPVPDGLAPEIAVFARLMGVSWTTLVTTRARPPARVLVTVPRRERCFFAAHMRRREVLTTKG